MSRHKRNISGIKYNYEISILKSTIYEVPDGNLCKPKLITHEQEPRVNWTKTSKQTKRKR